MRMTISAPTVNERTVKTMTDEIAFYLIGLAIGGALGYFVRWMFQE